MRKYILLLCLMFLCGCGKKALVGEFTAISTKAVACNYEDAKEVTGRAGSQSYCCFSISGVAKNENAQALAIENALKKAGVGYNLLVDARIYYIEKFGFKGYEATGIAVKTGQQNSVINNTTNIRNADNTNVQTIPSSK